MSRKRKLRGRDKPGVQPFATRRKLKRLNPRRVKLHRNYTVEEVAMLAQGAQEHGAWLAQVRARAGRRSPSDPDPGPQAFGFLHARRERSRQRCRPGQFYCLRCRAPREPASRKADYVPITPTSGNLRGTCADCGTRMYRRVSLHKLAASAGNLEVQLPQAQQRIEDTACPTLNSDLVQEPETYANAQSGK